MYSIKVKVKADSRVLNRMRDRTHWRRIPTTIAERLKEWVQQNFATAGGLLPSGPWVPLSANTLAAKAAAGFPSAPLVATGTLLNSFKTSVSGYRVTIGSSVPYAKFHERGVNHSWEITPRRARALSFMTANGRVTVMHVTHPGLPQRKMLPPNEIARAIANEVARAHIREQAKGRR